MINVSHFLCAGGMTFISKIIWTSIWWNSLAFHLDQHEAQETRLGSHGNTYLMLGHADTSVVAVLHQHKICQNFDIFFLWKLERFFKLIFILSTTVTLTIIDVFNFGMTSHLSFTIPFWSLIFIPSFTLWEVGLDFPSPRLLMLGLLLFCAA